MASLLNSVKDSSLNFTTGSWEDIKDYTSAIITIRSGVDGSATFEWADTSGRRFPTNNDIVASENFTYSNTSGAITKQVDHRARWFRVRYDHSGAVTTDYNNASFKDISFNLQTLYKKAPTELKIVDDCANIVNVNIGPSGNSLYTLLTDGSGVPLRTTNPAVTTGEALYVHLADSSGFSLATTTSNVGAESLFVALHDASNVALDTTRTSNNALFVRPGDASGNAQAATFSVSGSYTAGVALYAALSDNCGHQIDTTNRQGLVPATNANALFVHLTDAQGRSINTNNALPVINTVETTGAYAFDSSVGIQQHFTFIDPSLASAEEKKINIYNLFMYNDSPVTVWLKVYDNSFDNLSTVGLAHSVGTDESLLNASLALLQGGTSSLRYNIPVPGGRHRDIVLPGGATFNYGVQFRATTQYKPNSLQGPGPNAMFVNGSYTKDVIN